MQIDFLIWTWTIPDDVLFWIVAGVVVFGLAALTWLLGACLPPYHRKRKPLPGDYRLKP